MSNVRSKQENATEMLAHAVMAILTVLAIAPFLLLLSGSLTESTAATKYGYQFWPKTFSLEAYQYIAKEWMQIGRAYGVTIFVTIAGTSLGLVIVMLLAYGLCQADVPGVKVISFLILLTMLFNGGVVSTYIVYSNIFSIKDTIWALIFPNLLMNGFTVILVRNYIRSNIPMELMEAAEIDGAGQLRIFGRIVIPLSKPILATVGLLAVVAYWNDWTNGLYYISDSKLFSIQQLLNKMNDSILFLQSDASSLASGGGGNVPSAGLRMAIAVIGILPIMAAYPFLQKYFTKGITMGAVKG